MTSLSAAQKQAPTVRFRLVAIILAIAAAAVFAIAAPAPAQATTWWYWRTNSQISGNNTWYPVNTGATYNVGNVDTGATGKTGAYINTVGIGQSYGPGSVTQNFGAYIKVSSSCRAYVPILPDGATAYLQCRLGY